MRKREWATFLLFLAGPLAAEEPPPREVLDRLDFFLAMNLLEADAKDTKGPPAPSEGGASTPAKKESRHDEQTR